MIPSLHDQCPDPFIFAFPFSPTSSPWRNLLKVVVAGASSTSVHTHPQELHAQVGRSWQATLSLFFMYILCVVAKPMATVGRLLEIYVNVVRVNGGFLQMLFKMFLWRGITMAPSKDSRDYLSIIGNMELRKSLMEQKHLDIDSQAFAYLCVMAAKFAYENEAVIEYTINHDWNMNFVKFYNCWNDHLRSYTTQAFIFKDKPRDAEFVMLAFRGTEPFDAKDWSTDLDFSWYNLPGMGKIHVGFIEALGLGNRRQIKTFMQLKRNCLMRARHNLSIEFTSGLPLIVLTDPTKPLAFDDISKDVKKLLVANPNAKLCITGHSLGGALAVVFTAILLYQKDNEILERLAAIYTFGQPRVGDQDLAEFMERGLRQYTINYNRLVYLNDLIPRVPADDDILQFKHFGTCCYFNCLYKRQILLSEPNKNYFSPCHFVAIHLTALYELVQSGFLWLVYGDAFQETGCSTALRVVGLIFPGIADHSLVNYVNSVLLGPPYIEKKVV